MTAITPPDGNKTGGAGDEEGKPLFMFQLKKVLSCERIVISTVCGKHE